MPSLRKIYFACSIRGGRDDAEVYGLFAEHIQNLAHLLTEFADPSLTSEGSPSPSPDIWKKDIAMIKDSDAIIAEVTNPSLGVGYEIAKAEEWKKPVLVLFRDDGARKLSAMINGSPHVKICKYTDVKVALEEITNFIESL